MPFSGTVLDNLVWPATKAFVQSTSDSIAPNWDFASAIPANARIYVLLVDRSPGGTTTGDPTAQTYTFPAGYVQKSSQFVNLSTSNDLTVEVWEKVAAGSDTQPTITCDTITTQGWNVLAFHVPEAIADGTTIEVDPWLQGIATSRTPDVVTATAADQLGLVLCALSNDGEITITTANGWEQAFTGDTTTAADISMAVFAALTTEAGDMTMPLLAGNDRWGGASIIIAPAAGGTDATVTPAAVLTTTTIPLPGISASSTITPSPVLTTTTVPAPTVTTSATRTPAPVLTTTTIPTPGISASVALTPTSLSTTTTIPLPGIAASSTITPAPLLTTTTIPSPDIVIPLDATITPPPLLTTTTIPLPVISASWTLTPTPVLTTTSVPSPTVTIITVVTPNPLLTTTTIPLPSVLAINITANPRASGRFYRHTDPDTGDVRLRFMEGASRGKAHGFHPAEGWERLHFGVRFDIGQQATLELVAWPTWLTNQNATITDLSTALEATITTAGYPTWTN